METRDWWQLPTPPWIHRCRPALLGGDYDGGKYMVNRCACGAKRVGGMWIDKNETRKYARRWPDTHSVRNDRSWWRRVI